MTEPRRRFQVFISSSFEDLKEERRKVVEVLLELGCIPSGMEIFPAADDDPWSLIRKMIDDCDYVVLIIKGKLGSIHPEENKSYTQLEYEYALSIKKPVFSFLYEGILELPRNLTEDPGQRYDLLAGFRSLVMRKRNIKKWSNADELAKHVSTALNYAFREYPAEGLVRPSEVSLEKHPSRDEAVFEKSPTRLIADLEKILQGSRFARRLTRRAGAKEALARHALTCGMWRRQDRTFIDSGTIPVYLTAHLLRFPQRSEILPSKIITNNIPLGILELIEGGSDLDETQVLNKPKGPLNVHLLKGEVDVRYAATLPEVLSGGRFDDAELLALAETCAQGGVDHVVLMTTRLTAEDGPCVVGKANQTFKRAWLRYAMTHEVRVTLLAEAEKIVGQRDDAIDRDGWHALAAEGRISMVLAFDDRSPAKKQEIQPHVDHMRSLGIEVTLAGEVGAA